MVLNIVPRREKPVAAPTIEPERTLPEPSPEALEEPAKKTTRRGTRGGRGRRKPTDGVLEIETSADDAEPVPVAKAPRRSRAKAAPDTEAEGASTDVAAVVEDAAPVAKRTNNRKPAAPATTEAEPAAPPRSRRTPAAEPAPTDLASLIRLVEAQGKQLEQLTRAQEEMLKRGGGTAAGSPSAASLARVGVFVDAANVELAIDRLRTRVDWRKVLAMLTEHRTLVRAIAYSPVHDDPGVSIETQRFAEPFLHKGYKVVTKPLKRFADGTIKANVDIEMACDIIEMLDRLDVVCLVSGDGDFQRLVEVIQSKGVRVEVIAVGTSAAGSLRNAADSFTDLQAIIGKVKA